MTDKFKNSHFAHLYLWMSKAKFTMGIFFVFFALVYLVLGTLFVSSPIALTLWRAVQMMFVCFFIGLAQQIILPAEKLTPLRCLVWMVLGSGVTLLSSLVFQWFALFPAWCLVLFILLTLVAMGAILVSYYLELQYETRKLNQQLENFKKNPR